MQAAERPSYCHKFFQVTILIKSIQGHKAGEMRGDKTINVVSEIDFIIS